MAFIRVSAIHIRRTFLSALPEESGLTAPRWIGAIATSGGSGAEGDTVVSQAGLNALK